MGNVYGLHFFKVSKVCLALSQMEGIPTLNSYGHGYAEKIKFQLCFGVFLTVCFFPIFMSTDTEEKSLARAWSILVLLGSHLGWNLYFNIMPSSPRAGIQDHGLQSAYTCVFHQYRDMGHFSPHITLIFPGGTSLVLWAKDGNFYFDANSNLGN